MVLYPRLLYTMDYFTEAQTTLYGGDADDLPATEQPPQLDPPPNITPGFMSTVREPTKDLVDSWTTVAHIAAGGKLKGDITWTPSMAGSLIRLLMGEGEDPLLLEISELASVAPKQFEKLLETWRYSRELAAGNG